MAEIALINGGVAIVDDCDLALVSRYKWRLTAPNKRVFRQHRYVKAVGRNENSIPLHRLITGVSDELVVDHINGDTLDNRRQNLRVCTRAENNRNRCKPLRGDITSQYKGVSHKEAGRWYASISINGKDSHLGCYPTELDAAIAYDNAARLHYGPFAKTNFTTEMRGAPRLDLRQRIRQKARNVTGTEG